MDERVCITVLSLYQESSRSLRSLLTSHRHRDRSQRQLALIRRLLDERQHADCSLCLYNLKTRLLLW